MSGLKASFVMNIVPGGAWPETEVVDLDDVELGQREGAQELLVVLDDAVRPGW